MVDITDLGGDSGEGKSPSGRKRRSRIHDEAKGLGRTTLEEALGQIGSRTISDELKRSALGGTASAAARQIEEDLLAGRKAVEDAIGPQLAEYRKAQQHARDVLGGTVGEEFRKSVAEREEYMKDMIASDASRSALPPISLPRNPIFDTNRHLEEAVEKIDALVDLQGKQAELIDKLLEVQIANEGARERTDKRNYRLSFANMMLAAILGAGAIVATILVAG